MLDIMGCGRAARHPARAIAAALLVACAVALSSCGGHSIGPSPDIEPSLAPRLQPILSGAPLPSPWKYRPDGGTASYRLSLIAVEAGSALPDRPNTAFALCGTEYRAAAVGLSDARWSVDRAGAEKIGLEPLDAILPPRRALAVEGEWPPSAAYPFARSLYLSVSSRDGREPPLELARWLHEAAAKAAAADRAPLRLAAVGDIQIGEAQGGALLGGGAGLERLVAPSILARLRSADIAVANMESPVSSRGEPNPRKRYHFRLPKGASAAFKDAGFDLVLFGNNHAFDYGLEAFDDTLADLECAAMPMVGAGRNAEEASRARVLEAKGRERLAFVGFAFFPQERSGFSKEEAAAGSERPGIAIDDSAAIAAIRSAAAAGDTVVVLAHGGAEYRSRPSDEARKLYARFADAGAALVIGSHTHLLQGCAARSGSLIAYSLGNFLFTLGDEPPEAYPSAVLEFLVYKGKVRGLLPYPVVAGFYDTPPDADAESARRRFSRLSADIEALPALTGP
jgi:poly-gamma-glutamate synthesis protein (capsule biosynthesis protein)